MIHKGDKGLDIESLCRLVPQEKGKDSIKKRGKGTLKALFQPHRQICLLSLMFITWGQICGFEEH